MEWIRYEEETTMMRLEKNQLVRIRLAGSGDDFELETVTSLIGDQYEMEVMEA